MTGSPADPEAIRAVLRIIVRRTPTMPLEAVLEDVVLRHTVNATHEARRSPRSPAGHVWDVPRPAFDADGHLRTVRRDGTKTLENAASRAKAGRTLLNGLRRLPPEERVVCVLHDIEGTDDPEIAEILGLALPAVTSRVHQSRRWLRRALANAFDPGSIDRISRDG